MTAISWSCDLTFDILLQNVNHLISSVLHISTKFNICMPFHLEVMAYFWSEHYTALWPSAINMTQKLNNNVSYHVSGNISMKFELPTILSLWVANPNVTHGWQGTRWSCDYTWPVILQLCKFCTSGIYWGTISTKSDDLTSTLSLVMVHFLSQHLYLGHRPLAFWSQDLSTSYVTQATFRSNSALSRASHYQVSGKDGRHWETWRDRQTHG